MQLSAQTSDLKFIFKNYRDGYNLFRIPTIITTKSGKILAFCEGRNNLFDGGDIDLVMKTSDDQGKTWSKLKVIWNDGKNTCGNPCPVFDKVSGDVLIVATLNNDKVFTLKSKDEGNNWESPIEITQNVKESNWKWYATGPVHAIQLVQSEFQNRIIVPCNHTLTNLNSHISHTIYSDDNGKTWSIGGIVPLEKTDECTVSEVSNGEIILNMRNNDRKFPFRKVSRSADGGMTWTFPKLDSTLIEPICQGSLLRHRFLPNVLFFVNPKHKKKRRNLTLSISFDNGKTWKKQLKIISKKSAYNDIVMLENGDLLCIFESGSLFPYNGISSIVIEKSAFN
jgi:sialidase-1